MLAAAAFGGVVTVPVSTKGKALRGGHRHCCSIAAKVMIDLRAGSERTRLVVKCY